MLLSLGSLRSPFYFFHSEKDNNVPQDGLQAHQEFAAHLLQRLTRIRQRYELLECPQIA